MRIIRRTSRSVQGNTLVLTLVVAGLVGFVLVAYLNLVKAQNITNSRSQSWNAAIPIIEAGIEDAMTHLNTHGTTNLACDGWSQAGNLYCVKRNLGDGYYITIISNWVAATNITPVIDSRAFVTVPSFASRSPDWVLAQVGGPSAPRYLARGVRVKTRTQGLFTKAMVAKGSITFNGNARTDSFNAEDPTLSTDGRYDSTKTRDNGDVASNSQVVNAIAAGGNVKIYGHVSTGPLGTAGFDANAVAGSKTWVDAGTHTGVEPGWFKDDMNVEFPDPPPQTLAGRFLAPQNQTYTGTNYSYLLGDGRYYLCSANMSGSSRMMVTGKADLFVNGDFKMAGQSSIVITPGAKLTLWVAGTVSFAGQGIYNESGKARNCEVYGMPTCKSISMGGNAEFAGVIYAPYAAFNLIGGGNDEVDFIGSSITASVQMGGKYQFHYDESLANWGPIKGFTVVGWDEMTPTQVSTLPSGVASALGGN